MKKYLKKLFSPLLWGLIFIGSYSYCQESELEAKIDKEVSRLMNRGDIPGLSLVILRGNQKIFKNYGYADLKNQVEVNSKTLFEIGSLSKSFTALALFELVDQGEIDLDKDVSTYLPWFKVIYKNSIATITARQLLHHTSGIPWNTISKIPQTDESDALELTVKKLVGQELDNPPGKEYQYATIGYDVLALLIQTISGKPFEEYLQTNIIDRLGLSHTSIGKAKYSELLATGYKIGFSSPRKYIAPKYRGNNAAGYVISNGEDLSKWLEFQMGKSGFEDLYEFAKITHIRDETVPPHGMAFYSSGWHTSLEGNGELYHDGQNPNFSSYIAFRPAKEIGVVVLTNSNSTYSRFIGAQMMKILSGEDLLEELSLNDGNDKMYSAIFIGLIVYILIVVGYLVFIVVSIVKKKRRYSNITWIRFGSFIKSLIFILPFLIGIYILPGAILGFSWEAIFVWSPVSLIALVTIIPVALITTYLTYLIGTFFPEKNIYKRELPKVLLLSILAGLANVIIIIMVTSAIGSEVEWKYLVFYYALIGSLYLLGRKYVQINLIKLTRKLVFSLTVELIEKVFSTSFQSFEKIDRGRVYTALNDDVNTIGNSTNMFVTLITSFVTAIGAFLYLASLAFWATVLTIILIVLISLIYYFTVQSTNTYFEEARTSRNVFMGLINGMIDGFKELSLHRNKKLEYKDDIANSANEFRNKTTKAEIRFVNAFLVGESLLVILLGVVSIGMSKLFPSIPFYTILSFIIVLLYLIGPINAILNSVPSIVGLRIAWNRVAQFNKEIPANLNLNDIPEPLLENVGQFEAKGVTFQFENSKGEKDGFSIGPIDLKVKSGEILFLIGGNGSGKTTLAKLITGLYKPDQGEFLVNDKSMKNYQLGEYFSTVFNPPQLFDKLYNIEINNIAEVHKYLEILDLEKKVEIVDNTYSTIQLSAGQRKRLALLQCYLEGSPIYLFDEWAADQDPEYRKFFYETLLVEMKNNGKIVIVITHDDHYFHIADKVCKMNFGKLEAYSSDNLFLTNS
ncbi:cyclic peptide export ABC transporter [Maribacter sp. 2307UL18-2]|uniref:cyclic peptide export ABC transporter n=1 Tax=Maribacter sp. 2307UL18-2 TaxID=3386274 RepID=UPI0039BC9B36